MYFILRNLKRFIIFAKSLIVLNRMQQINIQYYNSPCGELILASVVMNCVYVIGTKSHVQSAISFD